MPFFQDRGDKGTLAEITAIPPCSRSYCNFKIAAPLKPAVGKIAVRKARIEKELPLKSQPANRQDVKEVLSGNLF